MISQRKTNLDETTVLVGIHYNANNTTGIQPIKAISSTSNIVDIETQIERTDSYDSSSSLCPKNCDKNTTRSKGIKLLTGVCGIYVTYLYYGTLQEDVYTYPEFHYVWFVQVVESLTNIVGAQIGRSFIQYSGDGAQKTMDGADKKFRIPHTLFMLCGASQICSKALTSLSLNNGLSYPITTLAKSSRMAPVMIGQLFLGNSKYSSRDYMQVLCIIFGTALLGLSKSQYQSSNDSTSTMGTNFIILSLFMDGITGGLQKRIKEDAKATGHIVKGFDFMFYTNVYMFIVSIAVAVANKDLFAGFSQSVENPTLQKLIFRFCICSAAGQSFIYYTIANFDPLVCSTVTTTRKILSVLLSIWYKGHVLNHQGWSGILLAFIGIASELQHKFQRARGTEIKDFKG